MRLLGNLLWIIFGGFISALCWVIAGLLWCITIVGIPVGLQAFKMASISLNPFGKEVEYGENTFSFIVNIIWIILSGAELAIANFFIGLFWCITVIGIPWGLQYFKIAKLALAPFGAKVVRTHIL